MSPLTAFGLGALAGVAISILALVGVWVAALAALGREEDARC